jgi:hypothetical protein
LRSPSTTVTVCNVTSRNIARRPLTDLQGAAIYHARIALAAHALREGDKAAAVRYMLDAPNAPPSPRLDALIFFGLDTRLANYLLKAGERESVAQFLEKSAARRTSEREQLLKDAAAIRAGRMPMSYQYMVGRSE